MNQPISRLLLAIFFIVAGVLHFVFPAQYASTMPPWLPWHDELVTISGVCEIAGGIVVLLASTRRATDIGLILLCARLPIIFSSAMLHTDLRLSKATRTI